jgi:alpha-mannosidase
VAVLNRGTPGSLVTPDGTLNVSLMRSCSAWPCGVWIDGERRTAPDGSSFAWQHWTHDYEYALAAGPGDWRTAGFSTASEDYNNDLLAVLADVHEGPLPGRVSLGSVEPAGVTLTALKPRGNPLAAGRSHDPAVTDGVAVRLRETTGRAVRGRVVLPGWRARQSDLLEESDGAWLPGDGHGSDVPLTAGGLACLALSPVDAREPRPAVPATSAPEPAQPVYTRYWMHGKGPAPAGNLPVAVHITPDRVTLGGPDGADEAVLRVTVACGLDPAAGAMDVELPDGLALAHGGQAAPYRYELGSGEHAAWDLTVRPAPGAAPGRYFVAAAIGDGLGQRLEDAALVTVGQPGRPDLSLPLEQVLPLIEADPQALAGEIGLEVPAELALAPGQSGELTAVISNRAASAVRGEAQLVSPFGSWPLLSPWTQGFAAGPGEQVTLRYPVAVPAGARAGAHWWAVVKVMYFGRVRYSQAVAVRITR